MTHSNKTFKNGSDSNYNACVGENGLVDLRTYADGYINAARSLLNLAIEDGNPIVVDTYVYPIIFNARHAIELYLKYIAENILKIRKESRAAHRVVELKKWLLTGHDIGDIWKGLSVEAIKVDRRFDSLFSNLSDLVEDFHNIDPTAQTFRYPVSNEDKKHLVSVGVINLKLFSDSFRRLEKEIKELTNASDSILSECTLGTYTKELSRKDLEDISKSICARDKWGSDEFLDQKKNIEERYGISKSKFNGALNIIQGHYEFAHNVGKEVCLESISATELKIFIDAWHYLHPANKDSVGKVDTALPYLEKVKEHVIRLDEAYKKCSSLKNETFATIQAIFEIGRSRHYVCEHYTQAYELALTEFNVIATPNDRIEKIHYLLKKTNMFRSLHVGLTKLRQDTLLCELTPFL